MATANEKPKAPPRRRRAPKQQQAPELGYRSSIHDPVAFHEGQPVSVLDRAVEAARLGAYEADIAARCGITRQTYREWIKTGTRAQADVLAARRRPAELTPYEVECIEFAAALERAETEGKLLYLGLADRLAMGGVQATKVVEEYEVDAQGQRRLKGRKVTTESTLPDSAMIRWKLAHRWPGEFGVRRVEVSGVDGAPIEVDTAPVDRLLGELERLAHQQAESEAAMRAAQETNGAGHTT